MPKNKALGSRRRSKLPPLSVAHYALIFALCVVGALAVIIGLMSHEMSQIGERMKQSSRAAAVAELEQAVDLIGVHVTDVAAKLGNWDETRQQLSDPTYYAHWRDARLPTSGYMPAPVEAVALYDAQGRILDSAMPRAEARMPFRVIQMDTILLLKEAPGDYLYYFSPIWGNRERGELLGYVGLKVNFARELEQLRKFRYVDVKTIRTRQADGAWVPLGEVGRHLEFDMVSNAELDEIQDITFSTMVRVSIVLGVASVLAYLFMTALVAKPLQRISRHLADMRQGATGLLLEPEGGWFAVQELEHVRQSLNDYQKRLDDANLRLEHKNEELWVLAHHDPLTGVLNRRAFEDDWEHLLAVAATQPVQLAFLLFDCDHFKAINDTYGHQTGDAVIRGIAQSLHAALRTSDRLYRLGGDEFATLLFDTDIPFATEVAQRCLAAVNGYDFASLGIKEPVRISIGVAHAPSADARVLGTLHRQADLAMYHAKRPGQQHVAVYSEQMANERQAIVSNHEMNAVYEAIGKNDLLEIHYQKIIRLPAREVDYYEALVRIRHNDRLIMPSGIFPVVETRRLEVEFDLALLTRVQRDLERRVVPQGTGVSINLSGASIVDGRVMDRVLSLQRYLDAYKVVIEVTETALITQINQASSNLERLRREGFRIALDDFGSGYSSLRYLSNMPVDVVKFDISMVRGLEDHTRQRIIVENLARLIQEAGYQLVAEGVETVDTLDRVEGLNFSHAQGYYIGRPERLG